MTAPLTYDARRERYMAFVEKTYSDKTDFAKLLFPSESELRGLEYSCDFSFLDFDTVKRQLRLTVDARPNSATFEKQIQELEDFIAGISQTSKGLAIFYDQVQSFKDIHVYGTLAGTLHAEPQAMDELYEYLNTRMLQNERYPNERLSHIERRTHDRIKRAQAYTGVPKLTTLDPADIDENTWDNFDLSEVCTLRARGFPICRPLLSL